MGRNSVESIIEDFIKGAREGGFKGHITVSRDNHGHEEKLALDNSTLIGGIPLLGPQFSGLSAAAGDRSVGSGFLTGMGGALGQAGGGMLGGGLGALAGSGLSDTLHIDPELGALLGGGLGGLGGMIGGGMIGAGAGRAIGQPEKEKPHKEAGLGGGLGGALGPFGSALGAGVEDRSGGSALGGGLGSLGGAIGGGALGTAAGGGIGALIAHLMHTDPEAAAALGVAIGAPVGAVGGSMLGGHLGQNVGRPAEKTSAVHDAFLAGYADSLKKYASVGAFAGPLASAVTSMVPGLAKRPVLNAVASTGAGLAADHLFNRPPPTPNA